MKSDDRDLAPVPAAPSLLGISTISWPPATVPAVIGYREVRDAARNWRVFSSDFNGETDVREYRQYPIEADPPKHGALRAVMNPFFARPRILSLEPQVRAIARSLVDELSKSGQADMTGHSAPTMFVKSLGVALGLGDEDVAEWRRWPLEVYEEHEDHRDASHVEAYLDRIFEQVRLAPGQDFFSHLAAAQIDGRYLSPLEQRGLGNLVLTAGRETTVRLIAGAVWHIGTQPDDRARLRADPGSIPQAIEELLRYLSPLPAFERRLAAAVEGPDGAYEIGQRVALNYASANQDPEAFVNPTEIDIRRAPNHHLAFGSGPHACIGAHLARLEARVFIEELLTAAPDFRVGDMKMNRRDVDESHIPGGFTSLRIFA